MAIYKGFSTYNRARKFTLTNFELVKQDLFNHFHIRRGEKLMNPNFGTIIWDAMFEPFTDALKDAIADDVKRIVSYDPRIVVNDIIVTEFTDGIQIEIDLMYVPGNQAQRLAMKFDRDTAKLTAR